MFFLASNRPMFNPSVDPAFRFMNPGTNASAPIALFAPHAIVSAAKAVPVSLSRPSPKQQA
jgi:hypothetical protein